MRYIRFLIPALVFFIPLTICAKAVTVTDASAPGKQLCVRGVPYSEVSDLLTKRLSAYGFTVIMSQGQFGDAKVNVPFVLQNQESSVGVALLKRQNSVEILISKFSPGASQFNQIYQDIEGTLKRRFPGLVEHTGCE